jgi:hypothetical protein
MYARQIKIKLMANSALEFTRLIEQKVIPLLRGQKRFQHEITLIAPERNEASLSVSGITRIVPPLTITCPILTS